MVIGLDKFREQFAGEEDKYIIIGGTACDVNLRDTNTESRDTVDIDIILIVENMTADFGRKFWNFIEDGGYHNRSRKRGEGKGPVPELFRFLKPEIQGNGNLPEGRYYRTIQSPPFFSFFQNSHSGLIEPSLGLQRM